MFRAIYESCGRAIIRFWDSLFIQNDEVQFLRMQIEKLEIENKRLIESLVEALSPNVVVQSDERSEEEWKPMGTAFESQNAKRLRLERQSYNRAVELGKEAQREIHKTKTVEDLENELGIQTGTD